MSTCVAEGKDHYACFITFYCYHPCSSLKFLNFLYTCVIKGVERLLVTSCDLYILQFKGMK